MERINFIIQIFYISAYCLSLCIIFVYLAASHLNCCEAYGMLLPRTLFPCVGPGLNGCTCLTGFQVPANSIWDLKHTGASP